MAKSPVSNLGFHPQTTVPFSISFNSATLRVTAHSSSGVCQPQKAALTPHFSPPLRSTVCCALVRFPFTTGTFFKPLRALMYQTHLLVTETGKREQSQFLQALKETLDTLFDKHCEALHKDCPHFHKNTYKYINKVKKPRSW